jgi:hypothetical protein
LKIKTNFILYLKKIPLFLSVDKDLFLLSLFFLLVLVFLCLNQLDAEMTDENLFFSFKDNETWELVSELAIEDADAVVEDVITLCSAYSKCCFNPMSVKYSKQLITFK